MNNWSCSNKKKTACLPTSIFLHANEKLQEIQTKYTLNEYMQCNIYFLLFFYSLLSFPNLARDPHFHCPRWLFPCGRNQECPHLIQPLAMVVSAFDAVDLVVDDALLAAD